MSDDGSVEITLRYPLTVNGQQVKKLLMRQPKVRDQRIAMKSNGDDADKEIRLFADLCMQSPDTLDDMYLCDYQKLREAYESFLSSRRTQPGVQ